MAGKEVSFKVKAKDEATGPLNKIAGSLNSFKKNVQSSTSGFTNLGKSISGLKNLVPGIGLIAGAVAGVTAAVKKSIQQMKEWEQAWSKIELSSTRLDMASKLNSELKVSGASLEKFASDLSGKLKNTIAGGDIMEAMAGIAFDKSDAQIKNILNTATDLSVALGSDLNTAVSQLNQTFSGSIGTLGKMFPELKTLSKEELEAGKAIDIVAQKVKGMGEAIADTTTGSLQRYKNSMGDLKEELGAQVTGYFKPMRNWLSEIAEGWATVLKNKRLAQEINGKIEEGTASAGDYFTQASIVNAQIQGYIDDMERSVRDVGYAEVDYTEAVRTLTKRVKELEHDGIWEANKTLQGMNAMERTARDGKKVIYDQQLQVEKEKLDGEKEVLQEIRDYTASDAKFNRVKNGLGALTESSGYSGDYSRDSVRDYMKTIDSTFRDAMDIAGRSAGSASWGGEFAATANAYIEKVIDNFINEHLTDLAKQESDRRKAMYDAQKESMDKLRKAQEEAAKALQEFRAGLRQSVTGNIGQMGEIIEAFATSDWKQLITSYVGQIVQKIANVSDLVQQMFQFVDTIVDQMLTPIVSILESIASPVVQFLQVTGQALGRIVELFQPLAEFLLGNIGKAISTVLMVALGGIYNGVTAIHNILDRWFNKRKDQWDYMDIAGNLEELWNGGNPAILNASSTATGSASYSGAKDVYITINYNHSYVNGDAREIALNIQREIKQAEALGY